MQTLFQLRLLVGYLGERGQANWWPTAFLDPASTPFLEPVFPKTILAARYHGVVEGARKFHDEHLNVQSYHLFRLPDETEQSLHELALTCSASKIIAIPNSKEEALRLLQQQSSGDAPVKEGPVAMGSISEIDAKKAIHKIASMYWRAFSHDIRVIPYFSR